MHGDAPYAWASSPLCISTDREQVAVQDLKPMWMITSRVLGNPAKDKNHETQSKCDNLACIKWPSIWLGDVSLSLHFATPQHKLSTKAQRACIQQPEVEHGSCSAQASWLLWRWRHFKSSRNLNTPSFLVGNDSNGDEKNKLIRLAS